MAGELTARVALELRRWDAHSATAGAIATDGPVGISVIDPGGDGTETETVTETEHLVRDDTCHWRAGNGSGGATPDLFGVHGVGWYSAGRYAYGRAAHPGRHTVTYKGHRFEVTPEPNRWWAIAQAVNDEDSDIPLATWGSP
jgi:hypothetical protein